MSLAFIIAEILVCIQTDGQTDSQIDGHTEKQSQSTWLTILIL